MYYVYLFDFLYIDLIIRLYTVILILSLIKIGNYFTENCKLKYLDISWNQFRTHGAMHISSGLKVERVFFFFYRNAFFSLAYENEPLTI